MGGFAGGEFHRLDALARDAFAVGYRRRHSHGARREGKLVYGREIARCRDYGRRGDVEGRQAAGFGDVAGSYGRARRRVVVGGRVTQKFAAVRVALHAFRRGRGLHQGNSGFVGFNAAILIKVRDKRDLLGVEGRDNVFLGFVKSNE